MSRSNFQSAIFYFGRVMFLLLLSTVAVSAGCDQLTSKKDTAQLNRIAETIEQAGPTTATVAQLETYLQTYPQDALAWTILGNSQIDLDDVPSATIAFENAIKINPNFVQAITGQGILLRQQGRYQDAWAMYQRALEVDPNYAQAYASMVALAIFRKDYAKAVQYGEKAFGLDSSDPVIAANLSIAYHYLGDVANRDKFKQVSAQLNYRSMDSLQQIFNGDVVVGQ